MNRFQLRYEVARAALEATEAKTRAERPAEPPADADDDTWEAHYIAIENLATANGTPAAREALAVAEADLFAWGKTLYATQQSALDIDFAASFFDTRAKLIAILMKC